MKCQHCNAELPADATKRARYCSARCRVAANRAAKHGAKPTGRTCQRIYYIHPNRRRGERGHTYMCGQPIPDSARADARYCSASCRRGDANARRRWNADRMSTPTEAAILLAADAVDGSLRLIRTTRTDRALDHITRPERAWGDGKSPTSSAVEALARLGLIEASSHGGGRSRDWRICWVSLTDLGEAFVAERRGQLQDRACLSFWTDAGLRIPVHPDQRLDPDELATARPHTGGPVPDVAKAADAA